jgi:hypothetical protein|tara:strand:- start:27 stop:368 length:342 start_codon:yes stop_codon:yes gene_type:complete
MQYKKAQYNNYQNKSSGSNGGTAKLTTTKKDGCILVVNLNNQNLVLKGYYQAKTNDWKLFPYYDKTKQNPQFNKPKPQFNQEPMDDQLPDSEREWSQGDATEFNPEQYEQELG